jgi:hypothetical protein
MTNSVIQPVFKSIFRPVVNGEPLGGILDQFEGAAAAYSLRSLSTTATNVVRVRRSSDNAEQDFTANQIESGALETWVGAGNDGFVTTWYDQSGNSNDAVQTTASDQPKIVDAGVLVTEGGRPALLHNRDWLGLDVTTPEVNYTAFVCASQSDNDFSYFYQLNDDGTAELSLRGGPLPAESGVLILRGEGTNEISFTNHSVGHRLISSEHQDSLSRIFYDGELVASGNIGTTTITRIGVGHRYDQTGFDFIGTYSEFIIYFGEPLANREAIQANIADYYGITLA